jgi:uncharacterized protein (UPF0335 family)
MTGSYGQQGHNSGDGSRPLLYHIERIEGLEARKTEIMLDIRDAKQAARFEGYDIKGINQMLKERKWSSQERKQFRDVCQVYRASLGMLDGTPLGESARRKFEEEKAPEGDPEEAKLGGEESPSAEMFPPGYKEGIQEAHAKGAAAAKAGEKVLSNPYIATDPRRSAWDEGYCAEIGHDGMELPPGLRSAKKPKKKSKRGDGE